MNSAPGPAKSAIEGVASCLLPFTGESCGSPTYAHPRPRPAIDDHIPPHPEREVTSWMRERQKRTDRTNGPNIIAGSGSISQREYKHVLPSQS